MNYKALDEALEYLDFIEEGSSVKSKYMNYLMSLNIKGQVKSTIKVIKEKLNELKSKEEKIDYLNKQKTGAKKGMKWRQNQCKLQAHKAAIERDYQKLFDFIDSELEKLK